MRLGVCVQNRLNANVRAVLCLIGVAAGLQLRAVADTVPGYDAGRQPITLNIPGLVDIKSSTCGQVGIGSVSPFPIHLRAGGMLSPVTKLAVGADITITGVHLLPSINTRIDGDVIFGSNLGGSQTLIPVTFDQLWSKSLPGGTSIYFGPGAGVYFGGKTRIGGKLALGASMNRFGVEANLDFAGIGNPLFLLQARLGL